MKKVNLEEPVEFICDCGSLEHQIRVSYDEECQHIYLAVSLKKVKFLRRLWQGIKYIFGYQCKYGGFEEIVLDVDKTKELNKYLKKCIKDMVK